MYDIDIFVDAQCFCGQLRFSSLYASWTILFLNCFIYNIINYTKIILTIKIKRSRILTDLRQCSYFNIVGQEWLIADIVEWKFPISVLKMISGFPAIQLLASLISVRKIKKKAVWHCSLYYMRKGYFHSKTRKKKNSNRLYDTCSSSMQKRRM